jgi:hypothetical protein
VPSRDLEAPPGQDPEWGELYVARGDEVPTHRPIYTGDVFSHAKVRTTLGREKTRPVGVLQHPCTMRDSGALRESLLVVRMHEFKPLPRDQWHTNERLMPLPQIYLSKTSNQANQALFFEELYLVHPDALELNKRVACLSELGVCLLLQRWMFQSSRLAVPRWQIAQANEHVYAEADLVEMWCEAATEHDVPLAKATSDADAWLSEMLGGITRRAMLQEVGLRSQVQRAMKQELKIRYESSAAVVQVSPPTLGGALGSASYGACG